MLAKSAFGLLSAQSMRQVQALEVTTNNVANVDTPGFKAVMLSFLPDESSHWKGKIPTAPREIVQFTQGSTILTGNPLDMAIMGEGFFALETPEGIAYTRDGRFSLNSMGELVNMSGHHVLGNGGVIVIDGDHIGVDMAGNVRVDQDVVDALRITRFEKPFVLERADGGIYFDRGEQAGPMVDDESKILGGTLEQSNVSVIEEMVRMIEINRVFESYQKVMQTIQELDQLSTNRVGRIG